MAEDLEEFLRRAAERRQQRSSGAKKALTKNKSDAQRSPPQQFVPPVESSRSKLPSATNKNAAKAPYGPTEADNRIERHIHDVFDHKLGNLQAAKSKSQDMATQSPRSETVRGTAAQPQVSKPPIEMEKLLKSLQNPETARSAFIASEIFRRRF